MSDYAKVEKAILYLERNFLEQPDLASLAKAVSLSQFHFQRLFSRWVGISPKRFVQYLTAEYAKGRLRQSRSVLDASFDSGLSSPGRIHDLLVKVEAMSPGEYKAGGQGLTIEYGTHASPFGEALIAVSPRGVCGLAFCGDRQGELEALKENWPNARFKPSRAKTAAVARQIFEGGGSDLRVLLKGTKFQLKVWQALLRVPEGVLISYGRLARAIDAPKASRAVGSAVGANAIAYLIPCHRVIRESGVLGHYRWGSARKKALIAWEAVTADGQET